MIDREVLKKRMEDLFEYTFGDSKEYVELVFDNYFHPDFVEYEERDGKIIAALLAIPYEFGNNKNRIKGVYLCGLSTLPAYRRQGIMGRMIDRIGEKMKTRGFSFMFLIPANEGLIRYYSVHQFHPAFYRRNLNFVAGYDFKRAYFAGLKEGRIPYPNYKKRDINVIDIARDKGDKDGIELFWENIKIEEIDKEKPFSNALLKEVVMFIHDLCGSRNRSEIFQSEDQLKVVIAECILAGGKVLIAKDEDNNIGGVGFVEVLNEEMRMKQTFYTIPIYKERIFQYVADSYESYSISEEVYLSNAMEEYDEKNRSQLWTPFYGAALPECPQVGAVGELERVYDPSKAFQVYGMVRVLDISEILKFQASIISNLKYSILVNLGKEGRRGQNRSLQTLMDTHAPDRDVRNIVVENGKIEMKSITNEKKEGILSLTDLEQLLFRKPTHDTLETEVFGIPPLGSAIYLMLD